MHKTVVIGEREKILPFKTLGMGLEYADSEREFEKVMEKLAQDPEVSLILVCEDIISARPEVVSAFREKARIPIAVLPSHLGSASTSIRETSKMVKRAIGVDILEGGLD